MKSILIVDDNELQQSLYKGMLASMPVDITPAFNITDAAALLRKRKVFDLVIMDIMLPDGSGIDALRDLRTLPKYVDTPVIVMSTRVNKQTRETLREAGATDCMPKPVDFAMISELLRHHLKVEA